MGEVTDLAPQNPRLRTWLVSDPKHGPLPSLLLGLTIVTGIVDAFSILALGRVFVANMTGNVVFVGFAAAGAPGFSLSASLFALAGFLIGAFSGSGMIARMGPNRGVLLRNILAFELVLVAGALALSVTTRTPFNATVKDGLAAMAAIAMGMQNSLARRLAVPDLTTTVLTMTLTGLAADLRAWNVPELLRRFLAVATMLVGAIAGALLVLHTRPWAALGLATGLLALVTLAATLAVRRPAPWQF